MRPWKKIAVLCVMTASAGILASACAMDVLEPTDQADIAAQGTEAALVTRPGPIGPIAPLEPRFRTHRCKNRCDREYSSCVRRFQVTRTRPLAFLLCSKHLVECITACE